MKLKHIALIIFIVAIIFILYLYKRGKSSDQYPSFTAELEAKERKLNLFFAELSSATIKKACLDRIAAWKISLITSCLVVFCFVATVIYSFYWSGTFPELYMDAAWYIIALFSAIHYQKIPSWGAITELIATRIRMLEYRNHKFNPDQIPVLATKIVVLSEEIYELKERQKTVPRQNECGYY